MLLSPRDFTPEIVKELLAKNINIELTEGVFDLGTDGVALNGADVSISGKGRGVTIITYSGPGAALHCNSDGTGAWGSLRDFTLRGNYTAGSVGLRIGQDQIAGSYSAQMRVYDLEVENFDIGLDLFSAQICRFTNLEIHHNVTGIYDGYEHRTTQTLFSGVQCRANTGRGLHAQRMDGCVFSGCQFESNGEEGIYLDNSGASGESIRQVEFSNCWVENNNNGRGVGAYSEVLADSSGTQAITNVLFRRNTFAGLGDSSYHIRIGKLDNLYFEANEVPGAGNLLIDWDSSGTPPRWLSPKRQSARLQGLGGSLNGPRSVYDLADGATTELAQNGDIFRTNNTSATSFSKLNNFNCDAGSEAWLYVSDGNTTVVHGTGDDELLLTGGVSLSPPAGTWMHFVLLDLSGPWRQT